MAKAAKASGGAIALPKGFKSGTMMPRKPVNAGGSGDAFIWIAHKQSGMWDDIAGKIKGLANGQFVFVSAGLVERLQPMKYHLLEAFHFFAEVDDTGEITTAYDEDSDSKPKEAKEFVEAVVVVYAKQGLRAARVTFKGPMVGAVAKMLSEYQAAGDVASWAKESKEHEVAARLMKSDEYHAFRFYGTASATPKTTRDGKFTYSLGNCQTSPSTSSELAVLKDYDFADVEGVKQAFLNRVSDVKSKM